jgi:hypothetical protein
MWTRGHKVEGTRRIVARVMAGSPGGTDIALLCSNAANLFLCEYTKLWLFRSLLLFNALPVSPSLLLPPLLET